MRFARALSSGKGLRGRSRHPEVSNPQWIEHADPTAAGQTGLSRGTPLCGVRAMATPWPPGVSSRPEPRCGQQSRPRPRPSLITTGRHWPTAKPFHAVPWWRGPLDEIVHAPGRGGRFRRILTNLGSFERGSLEREAENILRSRGDPVALLRVLDIPVDTPPKRSPESRHPHSWLAGTHDGEPQHRRRAGRRHRRTPNLTLTLLRAESHGVCGGCELRCATGWPPGDSGRWQAERRPR
jgi:hypothetical protein